jgi:16S rRNA (guanine527-N7)-methyltransferase
MTQQLALTNYFQTCLTEAKLSLDTAIQDKILAYVELLIKWNAAYNLTAIRDPKEMMTKHIMDSLSITPYINGERILDIGTGAGLPGILLALLKPESSIILLDSNGKKTRFLTQVKATLKLHNVEIVNSRVETYTPPDLFDCIVSRAFATIAKTLDLAQHLCQPAGVFLLMKGIYPTEEIAEMPEKFTVIERHRLIVPHVEGERCLICVGIK